MMKKANKEAAIEATEVKEIKASRFEVEQQLNNLVGQLKLTEVSKEGKLALIKLKIELTKVIKEIEDFRKITIESINKPAKLDELKEAAAKEDADDEVKAAFKEVEAEYNKEFAETAIPYYNTVVSIPFDYISEEDYFAIVSNNDLDAAVFGYEYLHLKLVKK